jgi:hypothetical protein
VRVAHLLIYLSAQDYDAGSHWELDGIDADLNQYPLLALQPRLAKATSRFKALNRF